MKEYYQNEAEANEKASKQIQNAQRKIKTPNYRAKAPSK